MSKIKLKISDLEKEIEKILRYVHELKEKNYFLLKENEDLKNKFSIFENDIRKNEHSDNQITENKEINKLKEKQERIKIELNDILKDINSVLN